MPVPNLANLTITGSTTWAIIAPTSDGTVLIASNISLDDGAVVTLKEGTIEFTIDGTGVNVGEDCVLLASPGEGNAITITAPPGWIAGTQMEVRAGAVFQVSSGRFLSAGPLRNSGGSVILESNTSAGFAGEVGNGPFGGGFGLGVGSSFRQTSGATYIAADASLVLVEGMKMTGGLLSIKSGTIPDPFDGHIVGNLEVGGGDIRFESMASGDNHEFARLLVAGNVTWTGGTLHSYVDGETDEGSSDIWYATGTFSVGAGAAVAVTAVDGENNVITPTSDDSWYILLSDAGITTPGADPSLSSGWTFDKDMANPKLWWKVKKT